MNDLVRNVVAVGVPVGLAAVLGRGRLAPWLAPIGLAAAAAAAVHFQVLSPTFALTSLQADVPWVATGMLALWLLHARSAWLRPTAWWAVVLLTALLGDTFVAFGLVLAEPDPGRRARLVLAASGASLCGWTSGEAALLLGHGAWPVMGLGLLLSAVGLVGGGGVARGAPSLRPGLAQAWTALCYGLMTWLVTLAYGTEGLATALEHARAVLPGWDALAIGGGSVLAGMLVPEGGAALYFREALERALSLRGDGAREAMLVGLSLGGGLPLLLATRSRLKVGVPLWLLQVIVGLSFLWWRWG